jgi:signal transduction histidine kinase
VLALLLAGLAGTGVDQAHGAEPTLLLDGARKSLPLLPHATILHDEGGRLTVEEVLQLARSARVRPPGQVRPRAFFGLATYWLHLQARGDDEDRTWFLQLEYPLHDRVDLVLLRPGGQVESRRQGQVFPFRHREVVHRSVVFRVPVAAHEPVTALLRIQSESAMILGATAWLPEPFFLRDRGDQQRTWAYFGFLLAVILYNLLLFFVVRDRTYLLFVCFTAALGALELCITGTAYEHLWPDSPWWSKRSIPFFLGLSPACAVLFTQHFLDTGRRSPRVHRVLSAFVVLDVLAMVLALASGYSLAMQVGLVAGTGSAVASFLAGVRCWQHGYRPARFYLLAVSALGAGLVAHVSRVFLVLPSVLLTQEALHLASAVIALVFTVILGDRINLMERERAQAREDALAAEQAARARINALNVELEGRVTLRTAELERKNAELARQDAKKDELVATVSHDFRSPLAIIRQNVQTIIRDLAVMDEQDVRSFLQGVERQETRLTSMCNHLLDLARIKQGGVTLEPVDLPALVTTIVDGFRVRATAAGVGLSVTVQDGAPRLVDGEPHRLGQALQNLVDNALRFTGQGGHVHVRVAAQPAGTPTVRLEVEDTGCGIPAQAVPRVFEPFFQVAGASGGQGSGLGLAIVAEVARAHGGEVDVVSQEGRGSTFSLTLPARQPT